MSTIYFLSQYDKYSEFSNFHGAEIILDGKKWPTTEHRFQAMKFKYNPEYQEVIRNAESPSEAKKLGSARKYKIREDWDTYRDTVMEEALYAKFTRHNDLKHLLLSTGDRELVENNKNDSYWGIGKGSGQNKLGKMLCALRNELKK